MSTLVPRTAFGGALLLSAIVLGFVPAAAEESGDDSATPIRREDAERMGLDAPSADGNRRQAVAQVRTASEVFRRRDVTTLDGQVDRYASALVDSPIASEWLFGVLSSLERLEHVPSRSQRALDALASRDWGLDDSTTIADWVTRMEREFAASTAESDRMQALRLARTRYERVNGESRPWPWIARRAFWIAFLETVAVARTADDPAVPFEKRLAADPEHAPLYTEAYLAVVRNRQPARVNFALIERYVGETALADAPRFRRRVLAVASVAKSRVPPGDANRRALEQPLIDRMVGDPLDDDGLLHGQTEVRWLFENLSADRRRELVRALFDGQPPQVARLFVQIGGMSDADVQWSFLAKPTEFVVRKQPLNAVVRSLQSQASLPFWIDPTVDRDDTSITIDARGTWLEVARQTLAMANHEVVLVDDEIVWIGPRARRRTAEATIRAAAGRVRHDTKFSEQSVVGFVDVPVENGLEFLADLHDMPIVVPFPSDAVVTFELHATPLWAVLAQLTERTNLEWVPFEHTVVVAPADRFDVVRDAIDAHRERLVTLRRLELESRLPAGLRDQTVAQFIDVPLSEAIEFTADLHELKAVFLSPERVAEPANLVISGVTVPTLLTLVLMEHGLRWDTDGEIVVAGTPHDVEIYRKLAATRAKRRADRPANAALTKLITFDMYDKSVAVLANLGAVGGVNITLGDGVEPPEKLSLEYRQVPFDVALDTVAVQLDAEWRLVDGKVVLSPQME